MTFTVIFDRVGQNTVIPPYEAEADTLDDLAYEIAAYTRVRLASRKVEAHILPTRLEGHVRFRGRIAGTFTVTEGATW